MMEGVSGTTEAPFFLLVNSLPGWFLTVVWLME